MTIQNRVATISVVPSASSLVIKALKEPPRDRKKVKNGMYPYIHNILFQLILSTIVPHVSLNDLLDFNKRRTLKKNLELLHPELLSVIVWFCGLIQNVLSYFFDF